MNIDNGVSNLCYQGIIGQYIQKFNVKMNGQVTFKVIFFLPLIGLISTLTSTFHRQTQAV
ncbi:hypothetical protein SBF1_1660020 [Candidatus Desulfosporosinus infrequens]|uniref:Uncharacterized protein n=1 Tax=Candidatus Desulfosporosinus infrequens TaxID=2043169 RepID=A0A2U3KAN1_9FIRM|nr:hypothetical protein SBF1_1660020 [Candidatus Desulfosporosinus infrequens]